MSSGWLFSFLPEYKGEWTRLLEATLRNLRKAAISRDENGAVAAVQDIESLEILMTLNQALVEGKQHPDVALNHFEDDAEEDNKILLRKEGRWLCFYRVYPTEDPPRGIIMFTVREDKDPLKLRRSLLGSE